MRDALETVTLSGARVHLRPLQVSDAAALVEAASDGALWNLPFTVVPSAATVGAYIASALEGRQAGHVLPFVTVLQASGQVVGSTRFWKIDRRKRNSVRFSIIDDEWPAVRSRLEARLAAC